MIKKVNIKHFVLVLCVVALTSLVVLACGEDAQNAAPVEGNAEEAVSDVLTEDEEAVVNEEAEAQAAREINEGNAEAKLQELEKEIDQDL